MISESHAFSPFTLTHTLLPPQLLSSAFHGLSPLSLSRTASSLRLSPTAVSRGKVSPTAPFFFSSFFLISVCMLCSQWGRDFRLDYRGLGCLTQNFPDVPVMALTATATQSVREVIKMTMDFSFFVSLEKHNVSHV